MKVLAVYDSPCIPKPFLLRDVKEWHWFSLTSGSGPLDLSLREIMHQEGRVKCLPSARLIDESFEKIANRVTGWSASFGQRKVAGRSLIDWFTLSNGQTSSWWFSLVSEKNHLQTDVFFRLAQLDALSDVLKSGGYDCLWVALEDPRMGLALRRMSKKKNVLFIPNRPARTKDGKERFRQWIVSLGCGGAMLLGGLWLFRFLTESVIARHVLGPWRKRFPPSPGPLIVAPFPMLDPWAAEEGRFVSKLFGPLHEELRRRGPLQWLFISVPYEGSTFFNSARMARRFSSPSETSYFLQEFASLLLMIKIFWLWGRQIFRAIWLNYWLPWRLIAQEISAAEGDVFLRGLWWQSFVGNVGIAGLVRFEIFKKALSFLGKRSTFCLHSAEMQAWEKALNAASERVCPELFRIGYQNTAISRRQLAFFYEPWEINPSSKGRGLPLPNVIACNGTEANRLLLTCCYPRVEQVEALRYLHLSDVLERAVVQYPLRRSCVLVVGSIDPDEALSLLRFVNASLPENVEFCLCFRPHPAMPYRRDIDDFIQHSFPEIRLEKRRTLSESLQKASLVIAGESSGVLEALAYGVRVVLPLRPDSPLVTPLSENKDLFDSPATPEELKKILSPVHSMRDLSLGSGQEFIRLVWNLDKSLARWKSLLNSIPVRAVRSPL